MSQQKCFKCGGEGELYPLPNKGGFPSTCDACKGTKLIDQNAVKCPLCEGTGKKADQDNFRITETCKLCHGNAYVDGALQYEKCRNCKGEGRFWPFENKRGIPSNCKKCKGTGYLPKAENEKLNPDEHEKEKETTKQQEKEYSDGKYIGYLDDKGNRSGTGKFDYKNGDVYIGGFYEDNFGLGYTIRKDGTRYEGLKYKDNEDKYGILTFPNGDRYEGNLRGGYISGPGEMYFKDGRKGIKYTDMSNSDNCLGIYYFPDGHFNHGHIKNEQEGIFSGEFSFIEYPNGDFYIGGTKNWKKEYSGTYIYKNGNKFIGKFKNDLKEGEGTLYNFETLTKEVINYKEDKPQQVISKDTNIVKKTGKNNEEIQLFGNDLNHAKITYQDKIYYCTINDSLEPNGTGILINKENGKAIYKGDFKSNEYSGIGHQTKPDGVEFIGFFKNGYYKQGMHTSTGKEVTIFNTNESFIKDGIMITKFPDGSLVNGENSKETTSQKIFPNGDYFDGKFSYLERNGYGRLYKKDGTIEAGFYENDNKEGKHKIYYPDGRVE